MAQITVPMRLVAQVETETRRVARRVARGRSAARASVSFALQAVALDPGIDRVEQTRKLQIRHRAVIAQRSGELRLGRRSMPTRRPTSLTPRSVSAFRSSVARSRRADELRRRHAPRAHDVVDLRHSAHRGCRARRATTGCRGRGKCAACGCARRRASVTSRPEREISSASCRPVAEAPTMRTPRASSCPGLR